VPPSAPPSSAPPAAPAPAPLPPGPVLVVDDEENLRLLLRVILERAGHRVVEAPDGAAALAQLEAHPDVRIVLCDLRMPRLDGLGLLDALPQRFPGRALRVVLMSAYGTSETAAQALSRGAFDCVSKPFRAEEIRHTVQRVLDFDALEAENARLRAHLGAAPPPDELEGFVGRSPSARAVMDLVQQAAAYPSTVLITGESGTGKELLARALHLRSDRRAGPFVPVNCAAIPEPLLESELFGHERGAFTGADRARSGLFEQADRGTLLLDEIGDMPLGLQTRLLRVLEDGRVRRVGGDRDRGVDVRVVAATSQDLDQAVAQGRFRRDLYYRLNVVRVRVPPLRERMEDLPLLVDAMLRRASARLGRPGARLAPEALAALARHPFPGNVRELENALERALLVCAGPVVELGDLPPELAGAPIPPAGRGGALLAFGEDDGAADLSIKAHTAALERHLITLALIRTGGNRTQAARLLELSTKALLYKIRDYGIDG